MTATTSRPSCRKIEPTIVRAPEGWMTDQYCATCGRDIEKMPTSWRHDYSTGSERRGRERRATWAKESER